MATKKRPTARTLELLRKNGVKAVEVVERYIAGSIPPDTILENVLAQFAGVTLTPAMINQIMIVFRKAWKQNFGHRKDWCGFGDILAVYPETLTDEPAIVMIQCCAYSTSRAHIKKIQGDCAEAASEFLAANGVIEVWAWRQLEAAPPGTHGRTWWAKVTRVEETDEQVLGDF